MRAAAREEEEEGQESRDERRLPLLIPLSLAALARTCIHSLAAAAAVSGSRRVSESVRSSTVERSCSICVPISLSPSLDRLASR